MWTKWAKFQIYTKNGSKHSAAKWHMTYLILWWMYNSRHKTKSQKLWKTHTSADYQINWILLRSTDTEYHSIPVSVVLSCALRCAFTMQNQLACQPILAILFQPNCSTKYHFHFFFSKEWEVLNILFLLLFFGQWELQMENMSRCWNPVIGMP